jgi:hypothetical protein
MRGFVYTSKGAFAVIRGIVDVPEAVGESFGWIPVVEPDVSNARTTTTGHEPGASAPGNAS